MSKNKIHKELWEQVIVRVEMTPPPPPRNSINWALNMHPQILHVLLIL